MGARHHCSPKSSILAFFFFLKFPSCQGSSVTQPKSLESPNSPMLHEQVSIKQLKYHIVNTKYHFSMKLRHSCSPTLTAQDILSCRAGCCLGHVQCPSSSLGPVWVWVGGAGGNTVASVLCPPAPWAVGDGELPKAPSGIFQQLLRESIGAAAQPCAQCQPCWKGGHGATLSLWVM